MEILIIFIAVLCANITSTAIFNILDNKKKLNELEKREAPKNINGLREPMDAYNAYKDTKSKLYTPIKPRKGEK